jgi:cell wall-associated NlpC family hydrolase
MRQVAALIAAAAALLGVATSASADPSIASKQEQARAILEQVQEMDMALGRAVEAYNGATLELNRLDADLQRNARHLDVAKRSLATAQTRIAARLRELYVNGGTGGVVEIVLGAESLDDLLTRIDMVERVGAQDTKVVAAVKRFQREVRAQKVRLQKARADQAEVVAERASQKHSIEGQLAERQRLLSSVRSEISQLQAEERRRQAAAATAARARLAAQREAARISALIEPEVTGEADPGAWASGSDTPAFVPPPPDGSRASQVIAIAMQYLGVPYQWGGSSPATGFDCSGFVMYVFAQIGVGLPHHAAAQYGYGVPVPREALQPGDLVFFNGLGHMGMYVGGGQFIHAPHTGDVVKISSIYESWYARTWVGGRRVL